MMATDAKDVVDFTSSRDIVDAMVILILKIINIKAGDILVVNE